MRPVLRRSGASETAAIGRPAAKLAQTAEDIHNLTEIIG
jgi:hypothetical protein